MVEVVFWLSEAWTPGPGASMAYLSRPIRLCLDVYTCLNGFRPYSVMTASIMTFFVLPKLNLYIYKSMEILSFHCLTSKSIISHSVTNQCKPRLPDIIP